MLSILTPENHLDRLTYRLRLAPALTPDLFSHFVAEVCTRLPALSQSIAGRPEQLARSGAWSDAVLALIELELPAWKLRRLVYEDGEWHCSLSAQPSLPAELDDTADASHDVLPLAILCAFLEARRRTGSARQSGAPMIWKIQAAAGCAVCCDNFA